VKPVDAVTPSLLTPQPAASPARATGASFAETLKSALASVSQAQQRAAELALRYQREDPAVSLEQTMIAMAQANVSFQALLAVRNRLVQAYQDIMNMPV